MRIAFAVVLTLAAVIGLALLGARAMSSRRARLRAKPWSDYEQFAVAKQGGLERVLGPMHDMVGHALIPFHAGGNVDMYYFPHGIPGTGFATMELIGPDGSGPLANVIGTYELVAFTRLPMDKGDLPLGETDAYGAPASGALEATPTPYDEMERRMCDILTVVAHYADEAVMNPGDTCEVPVAEGEPTICLILDEYSPDGLQFEIAGAKHCLLLCMEVHRSEMEYAMEHGSASVLKRLRASGHYPYSDLNRHPVF